MCNMGSVFNTLGSIATGGISDVAGITDNDWGKDLVNIATAGTTNLLGLTDSNSDIVNAANMFAPLANIDRGLDTYKSTGDWSQSFDAGFDLGGQVDRGAKKFGENIPEWGNDVAGVVGPAIGSYLAGPVGAAAGKGFTDKMRKGAGYEYGEGFKDAGTVAAVNYAVQGAAGKGWNPSGATPSVGPGDLDDIPIKQPVEEYPAMGDVSLDQSSAEAYDFPEMGDTAAVTPTESLLDKGTRVGGGLVDAGISKAQAFPGLMQDLGSSAFSTAKSAGGSVMNLFGGGGEGGGGGMFGGSNIMPLMMAAGVLSNTIGGKQKADQEEEYNRNLVGSLNDYLSKSTWNDQTRADFQKGLMGDYSNFIAGATKRAGANSASSGRGGGYFGSQRERQTQGAREAVAKGMSKTYEPANTSPEVYTALAKAKTGGLPASNSFFSGVEDIAGKWPYLALMMANK